MTARITAHGAIGYNRQYIVRYFIGYDAMMRPWFSERTFNRLCDARKFLKERAKQ